MGLMFPTYFHSRLKATRIRSGQDIEVEVQCTEKLNVGLASLQIGFVLVLFDVTPEETIILAL